MTMPSQITSWRVPEKGSMQLFEKQRMVLDFIEAEATAGREFPTEAAIAKHMGWKQPASARDCLLRLRFKGFVSGERHFSRETLRVTYDWKLNQHAQHSPSDVSEGVNP
jgi:hypothetical protein